MKNLIARFVRGDDGLELIETAVVMLVVLSAGATAFSTLGVNIQNAMTAVNTVLSP